MEPKHLAAAFIAAAILVLGFLFLQPQPPVYPFTGGSSSATNAPWVAYTGAGGGGGGWTLLDYIRTQNNAGTTATVSPAADSFSTKTIKALFNISTSTIPSDATIDGIQISVRAGQILTGTCDAGGGALKSAQLVVNNSTVGSEMGHHWVPTPTITLPFIWSTDTYGNNSTTWGVTGLTGANMTNTKLGFIAYFYSDDTTCDQDSFYVDVENVTVWYTNASTPSSNTAPNITAISVVPASPTKANNISCNITVRDAEQALTNITFEWYKNGTNQTALAGTYNNTANNTATLISSLTSGNFSKLQNWSCRARAFDGTDYSSWNMSANVTIANSAPTGAAVQNFSNATAGHWFLVNGTVTDLDGGTDILVVNYTASTGTCTKGTNTSVGNIFNVKYNCSSTTPATATISIGFNDSSGSYVQASASNGYPNQNPTIVQPTITPAKLFNDSTATCNAGAFSDVDGDTENVTARVFNWYKNGTQVGGTGSTLVLSSVGAGAGSNISCRQNSTNTTWSGIATNLSLNSTVIGLSISMSSVASKVRFPVYVPPAACVNAINQTAIIGIYNVSVTFGSANIVANINQTFSLFNMTLSNSSSCSAGFNLTTSNQTIISALSGQSYIWAFANALTGLEIPPRFTVYIGGN